ncbi:MAG: autotransporter domain-containing protein, partial [Rhizobacter sp.]
VDLAGSGTVLLGARNLTVSNASSTYAGVIDGSGGLAVAGGTQTLSGVNGYTGATSVANGATLVLSGSGSIAASSGLANGGTVDISATTAGATLTGLTGSGTVALGARSLTLSNANGSYAGGIGGSGGLVIAGGSQTLSGVTGYTGATSVANGATLALSGSGSIAASSGLANNGTFDISSMTTGVTLTALTGSGTVALGSLSLTLSNASSSYAGSIGGSGGLAVVGGTQTLSGVNAYTGQTTIGSGATLALAGNGAIATSSGVANAGTLDISAATAGATVSTLSGAGQVQLGARTLTVGDATGFTGAFSGSGGLTVNGGALVLAGTQAYTGLTTVGNGALVSANGQSAGGFAVNAGGTLHGSGTIAGAVTVASGGRLSTGNSPGVLTVNAPVSLAPGAVFEAEVNGNTPGNGAGFHDQLRLVGSGAQFNANGATLEINLTQISGIGGAAAYVPQWGDSYRIVTAEGGLGTTRFADLTQPDGLAAGMRLRVFYTTEGGGTVDVRVVPLSLAANSVNRGLNRNAISVASAIDRMVDADTPTPAQTQLADAALALDDARFDSAAVGLAGEIHGAMAAAQSLSGQGLQGAVTNHLTLGGAGRLWVDYGTGDGRWSADAVSSSARSSRNQFTLGLDVVQTETTRLGAAVARSTTQVASSAGGSGKLEEDLVVVYGQYTVGDWKIDAQLGGGRGTSTTHRADPLATSGPTVFTGAPLATDLGTDQRFASIGVRMPSFAVGGASVEPFARIATQRVERDAGREDSTSPTALGLAALSATGTRVSAGATLASTLVDPMVAPYTLRGALAVGYDGGSLLHPTVSAELAGVATTIEAPQVGRAFAQARFSGTWLLARNAYVYGTLQGEARSQRVETAVSAGAAVGF